jgi:hypothetical protein
MTVESKVNRETDKTFLVNELVPGNIYEVTSSENANFVGSIVFPSEENRGAVIILQDTRFTTKQNPLKAVFVVRETTVFKKVPAGTQIVLTQID